MGVNRIGKAYWFEDLYRAGVFESCESILELGPQDIYFETSPDMLDPVIDRLVPEPATREQIRKGVFRPPEQLQGHSLGPHEICLPEAQKTFYSMLGLKDYTSIDLEDERADIRADLNHEISLPRQYDVVTNFGTLEHVFNIGQGFKTIHDAMRVGGTALHMMPAYGDYGHGFYNIHCDLYRRISEANDYALISLYYIKDLRSHFLHEEDLSRPRPTFDLDIRQRRAVNIDFMFNLNSIVTYYKNSIIAHDEQSERPSFDYIYAAYRKQKDTPFLHPQQV